MFICLRICVLPIAYAKPMPGWMHSAADSFGGPAPGVAPPPAPGPSAGPHPPRPLGPATPGAGPPNASRQDRMHPGQAECIQPGIGLA